MKEKIQCLPLPIGGVVLALFSFAKLLLSINMTTVSYVMIAVGSVIVIGLILKIVLAPEAILNDMYNAMIVAVMPTWTMAFMVLSSLWMTHTFWEVIWYAAMFAHFALMIYFTYRFVVKVEVHLKDVYPSWFIMYIGMGVMPLTAGDRLSMLMTFVTWACIGFALLFIPLLFKRIATYGLPTPTRPLMGILAAPASLITAGYIAHASAPKAVVVIIGITCAQLLYGYVLTQLPNILKLPFFPTYAALTFPFVISATALMNVLSYLEVTNVVAQLLVSVEIFIAFALVTYVTIRYGVHMYKQMRATSMASV